MALTQTQYTGNGSTVLYNFTFPYLTATDVKVKINGVTQPTTEYSFANATTVQMNTAPANGATVLIFRDTNNDNKRATFYPGSAIKAEDLNENIDQILYVAQEVDNNAMSTLGEDAMQGNLDLGNNKIINLANPTNGTDGVNKTTLEATINSNVLAGTDLAKTTSNNQVTINHDVAGANTTINNSNGNVLQDITVSAQGHVTSAGSVDLDTRYYTETELDAGALDPLYFRQDSSETIASGQTWSASDSYVATTAAIDARIIDLVDEVGGFDIVNDEQSFPDTNPGGTTGQAAVLSIKAATTNLVPSGTTVTITNGNLANNANITITGVPSTIAQGFGFLVESTSTLHTYTFHRLVPKATEVTTVASNATAVANVGNNIPAINTANSNSTNISTVASNIGNVNNVGTNIADVNTVATNIADVNNYADTYQVASSDPTARADSSSLQEGDLYFNSTSDELKVYNGSAWQGGVTATGNLAGLGSNTFTGNQTINGNVNTDYIQVHDITLVRNNANIDPVIGAGGSSANVTFRTNQNGASGAGTASILDNSGLQMGRMTEYVKLAAPVDQTGQTSYTFTFPPISGSNNQVLTTDGNGTTSWSTIDLTSLSATNLTSGTIPDARFPATLPASSGANLTSLPAANLTGTLPDATFPAVLPAVSAANLTNLPETGGLVGGSTDKIFIEADNVMNTDFTTGTNKNYLNLLPLTINATLTVSAGSQIQFVTV